MKRRKSVTLLNNSRSEPEIVRPEPMSEEQIGRLLALIDLMYIGEDPATVIPS